MKKLLDENFSDFNKGQNTVFLKNFFVNITTLGDSFWYFFLCFIGIPWKP